MLINRLFSVQGELRIYHSYREKSGGVRTCKHAIKTTLH